jgi:CHAD domain-containing protein
VLKRTPSFDLREALRAQLLASVAAFDGMSATEAVHRGRTALKRVRALARLGHETAPELAGQIIAGIRPIMRRFSDVRDLDAVAACAKFYGEQEEGRNRRGLMLLARKISKRRSAMNSPPLADAAREIRALVDAAQAWPLVSDPALVHDGARRMAARARKAFRSAQGTKGMEDRHTWRQREKERLYAALLLGDAWPKKLPRRRRRSQRLGELLGLERDTLLLLETLREAPALAGGPDDSDRLQVFLSRRLEKLRKQTDRLGKRLHAD